MRKIIFSLACGLAAAGTAAAQSPAVRTYQENGVTYRESRYTVSHPVVETRLVEQPQTVYQEQITSQTRDTIRTYQVPVTEYRTETYLHGRWNPFVKPIMAERVKPITYWQTRSEVVKVPYTQRQYVPQTTTVRVPVTMHRMVNEEVTSRVAISGSSAPSLAPGSQASAVAATSPAVQPPGQVAVGGVSKLEQDPPRMGANYQWRPADPTRR